MGFRIPGGFVFEPADTGFNGTTVNGASNLTGTNLPWQSGYRFHRVVFVAFAVPVGAVNYVLQFQARNFDESIIFGAQNIVTAINSANHLSYFGLDTARATVGAANSALQAPVLGAPMAAITINNIDAAAVDITLRIMLLE